MKNVSRKILCFLFALFFILQSVNAQTKNLQKIWDVNCPEYKNICILFLLEGKALPNSAGPWSTAELLNMMSLLEGEYENEEIQSLFDITEESLSGEHRIQIEDGFAADFDCVLAPEFYVHSNSENFTTSDDWNYDCLKRTDLFDFNAEVFASSNFYGFTKASIGYICFPDDGSLYGNNFVSNIPVVFGTGFDKVSVNFPSRALFAFGGDHWSLSAGRDVYRWGNGETGNLFLGGNSPYDNGLRFSAFSNKFKYSFVTNFYPHASEVLAAENNTEHKNQLGMDFSVMNGFNAFIAHRLDFSILQNRLNFSINEGIMYQTSTGTIDLRVFNPFLIYHSLFIRANANSILGLDIDYTVLPGLNVYGQMVLDEASFINEGNGDDDEPWHPSKMGYLAGVKYTLPAFDGIFKFNLEGVYADPCLYLREKYDSGNDRYGVSFYGAFREFGGGYNVRYIRRCLGYKYGGDLITGDLKASYMVPKKWHADAEIFYMAHGIMNNDLANDWVVGKGISAPSTTENPTDSDGNPVAATNEPGEVEHTLSFSLSGSYSFLENLSVNAGFDNIFVWNKNNESNGMTYDFQFHTGLKFTF